ncbi:hypothetical protein [Sulfurimonas indica]|nr:hypothetical protein [Sulfurimonas indica]
MFKTREGYQELIRSAVSQYNILDYPDKSKIVFVFEYNDEKYSVLLAVDKSKNTERPLVTVVTVEKIGSRHFGRRESFHMERIKIYSDFILTPSFLRDVEVKIGTYEKKYAVYRTVFFNKLANRFGFDEKVDQERLISSIISSVAKKKTSPFQEWVIFSCNGKKYAIMVSIEKVYHGNFYKTAIIFADLRNKVKSDNRGYVFYNRDKISQSNIGVGIMQNDFKKHKQPNIKTKIGLTIKQKSNHNKGSD